MSYGGAHQILSGQREFKAGERTPCTTTRESEAPKGTHGLSHGLLSTLRITVCVIRAVVVFRECTGTSAQGLSKRQGLRPSEDFVARLRTSAKMTPDVSPLHISVIEFYPMTSFPGGCPIPIDLALVLDSSGSIGRRNWVKVKRFAKDVIDYYDVSEKGTHIGNTPRYALFYARTSSFPQPPLVEEL
ncbi:predicted protein [Nematostella vectensis]|uniref:VWFA domain-containing protein n=1 Tax=Nematostella vectensis TaxID=45351 RepID=A7SJB8_NEMVE|nr:predicted protein [Nematostella vectensis]|eukprot:XP_001628271.1 predicted protein [Nematostella vectensis]